MQKHNVCPYYKNGYCTSPALDQPTDAVTASNRCLGQLKTCRYFIEQESKSGIETFTEDKSVDREIKFYPKINVLEKELTSECENYKLIKSEKGVVAYCKAIGRVLVTQQAVLCSREFSRCPFRTLFGT